MKCLLFFCVFILSSQAFSQSMVVLKNGKILTIDEQGMIYDLGLFKLPYTIAHFGGRFLVDQDRAFHTLDNQGLFYTKDIKTPKKVEHIGENFLISKLGKIFTVDEQGFLYENKREKAFRNVKQRGGNFLITEKKGRLHFHVINLLGGVVEVSTPEVDLSKVNEVGGRYFTTLDGTLFTVSNDGFIYSKKEFGVFKGREVLKGGNFFFYKGNLYTVTSNGLLMSAGVAKDFGKIKLLGTNFFINTESKLFTVSANGAVNPVEAKFKLSDISQISDL